MTKIVLGLALLFVAFLVPPAFAGTEYFWPVQAACWCLAFVAGWFVGEGMFE